MSTPCAGFLADKNFALHNVAEVLPHDGGWLLQRIPEAVRSTLGRGGQEKARHTPNVEIRFVWDWQQPATVTLASLGQTRAIAFCGDYQGRELHGVSGPGMRKPLPAELPKIRYLAYGSSITHGVYASTPHATYPARVGLGSHQSRFSRLGSRRTHDGRLPRGAVPSQKADALLKSGKAWEAESKHAQARAEYEKVLALDAAALPAIHRANALIYIADSFFEEKNYPAAEAAYGKVIAEEKAPARLKRQAERKIQEIKKLQAG